MTREDAQQVLAGISGFDSARVESLMRDGLTHWSWRIVDDGAHYVLRLDKPAAARLGLDRRTEAGIHRRAADAGLAPRVAHWSEGVMIREFIQGRPWSPSDLRDPGQLAQLAGMLRSLHELPVTGSAYDPLGAARRYTALAGGDDPSSALASMERIAGQIDALRPPNVPCHNDLLAENIFQSDRLFLMDWEYAGCGDPLFDLAVVIAHHGLSDALANVLLRTYLGRPVTDTESERLALQQVLYRRLLEVWDPVSGSRGQP
jgi:thiamine kinase-like enzyme